MLLSRQYKSNQKQHSSALTCLSIVYIVYLYEQIYLCAPISPDIGMAGVLDVLNVLVVLDVLAVLCTLHRLS